MTSLSAAMLSFQDDFLLALASNRNLGARADEWDRLESQIAVRRKQGTLDRATAVVGSAVASTVALLSSAALQMQQTREKDLNDLCRDVENIMFCSTSPTHPDSKQDFSRPLVANIEEQSTASSFPADRSPPRSPENSTSTEPAAIRHWFASNLYFPYPTPAEKASLAAEAGISIKKISSNLCNLRRRSGWQALVAKYCNGDRDEAHVLFGRVQSGDETRKEVLVAVEKLREYATRNLVVRDWVPEVTRQSIHAKQTTYQALSAAPAIPTTATITDDVDAIERLTPQRSFSNSSTDTNVSHSSSASNVSTSIPSTPAESSIYTPSTTTSAKRSLNPDAGEFVPAAKRVRIRFNITEPEPEPESAYEVDPKLEYSSVPPPSVGWSNIALSQPLWMGTAVRELSPFSDASPSPTPIQLNSIWDTPSLPAPEPDATFMSIFGFGDAMDSDKFARISTPTAQ